MATKLEVRTRSQTLETHRHKLERREQQLAEQKHELELRKYQLETNKEIADVLKHFTTVTTALLIIVGYFGNQIIPGWRDKGQIFFGLSMWDIAMACLAFSFGLSLGLLVVTIIYPQDVRRMYFRFTVIGITLLMAVPLASAVVGLTFP